MENTVQARLKAYLSEKRISQSDFGRSIGVSAAYVGSIRRGIDPEKLRAMSKAYPDLNLDWLVYGTGDMIKSSSDQATTPDTVLLLPWEAKGGLIGDFADAVQEYQCERIISPIRGADFAMQVAGDSMSPEYPSGSVVLIKKINEEAFVEWGKVYVLDTPNGAVIKQIRKTPDPHVVECVSINPGYQPFTLDCKYINGWYRVMMVMSAK